jgi:uncharacterized protein YjbJ (UPF0337 family)
LDGGPSGTVRASGVLYCTRDVCARDEEELMNADIFKGQWKQLKGDIKMRWNQLTDDDLEVVDGAMEKLEGKLQERYGWGREETRREIETWGRERGVWV